MIIPVLWFMLLQTQSSGAVDGVVTDRTTGAGIPNVTVKVAPASDPTKPRHVVATNAAGGFRIEDVAEGDYVAVVDPPRGYRRPAASDVSSKRFHVGDPSWSVKLNVQLAALASLRGRIVDVDRRPVPNVRVELFMATGGGGETLMSDSEGRFTFEDMLPGAYKLRARPVLPGSPLAERSKAVSPISSKPPENDDWTWVPTYFPNATDTTGAETIVLREGADSSGYEIRLQSRPAYRLAGVVADEDGTPLAGVKVSLVSEIGWGVSEAATTSGPDGRFHFASVRAGTFEMRAEQKRDNVTLRGYVQVMMPDHDFEEPNLTLWPPFRLAVLVDGIPVELASRASAVVGLVSPTGSDHLSPLSRIQNDGSLTIEDVYPGRYRVAHYGSVPGYYLQSVLLGTQDVTGQDFVLTVHTESPKLIYKANPGRAQGKLEGGRGVKVVLVNSEQNASVPGQDVRVASCDAEGRFEMEGLRPTTYFAFAFQTGGVNTDAVKEAVFVLGLARDGKVVRVAEGETVVLDLKITPFPDSLQRP